MTKILFRPQRGSLADAMSQVVKLDATKSAVLAHVKEMYAPFQEVTDIKVEPYGYDARIKWDTWLVLIVTTDNPNPSVGGYINGIIRDD